MKKTLLTFMASGMMYISAQAQVCTSCNFPAGWTQLDGFVIDNSANPNPLTNYQVKITVNTQAPIASGQMNNDGSDIRFYADCSAEMHCIRVQENAGKGSRIIIQ